MLIYATFDPYGFYYEEVKLGNGSVRVDNGTGTFYYISEDGTILKESSYSNTLTGITSYSDEGSDMSLDLDMYIGQGICYTKQGGYIKKISKDLAVRVISPDNVCRIPICHETWDHFINSK